jgi:hypothetical protein
MTVVAIFADGFVVIERLCEGGARVERRLNVVDAAAVVVVGGVGEDAELLLGSEALAGCAAKVIGGAAILDGRVATVAEEIEGRCVAGLLSAQID